MKRWVLCAAAAYIAAASAADGKLETAKWQAAIDAASAAGGGVVSCARSCFTRPTESSPHSKTSSLPSTGIPAARRFSSRNRLPSSTTTKRFTLPANLRMASIGSGQVIFSWSTEASGAASSTCWTLTPELRTPSSEEPALRTACRSEDSLYAARSFITWMRRTWARRA